MHTRLAVAAIIGPLLISLPALPLIGQIQQSRVDPPWVAAAKDSGIVLRIGEAPVRIRKDLSYKRVDGEDLLFDLYSPPATLRGPYPLVILVHGGPIPRNLKTTIKNFRVFGDYGRAFASEGMAAIAFDHRLYSETAFDTSAADVRDLVSHARRGASDLGIDPDRVCLFVFSYGGPHLASTLREQPPYLRCLLASSPVMGVRRDTTALMSPTAALREATAVRLPIFFVRAGRDAAWINTLADAFLEEAVRKNVHLELHNYQIGQHSFETRDDSDESRAIIRAALAFARRHLLAASHP